jgi:glycerol-3-phosphate acyltransferase PlsY
MITVDAVLATLLWGTIGFLSGSLMFAYWLGQLALKRDIRAIGDGNPGTTNLLKAGGIAWGGLAMMLEITKGALPVGLARWVFGLDGLPLLVAALTPVLGHAFSPFVNFRGGKAVAVTGGVWIGLTLWQVPLVGMIALVLAFALTETSGYAIAAAILTVLLYLLISPAEGLLVIIWILNGALLLWKYRRDFNGPPRARGWLRRRLKRA